MTRSAHLAGTQDKPCMPIFLFIKTVTHQSGVVCPFPQFFLALSVWGQLNQQSVIWSSLAQLEGHSIWCLAISLPLAACGPCILWTVSLGDASGEPSQEPLLTSSHTCSQGSYWSSQTQSVHTLATGCGLPSLPHAAVTSCLVYWFVIFQVTSGSFSKVSENLFLSLALCLHPGTPE